MVAHFNMHLEQIDVKTMFLHGKSEEKILLKQLESYECKVKRGLCQYAKDMAISSHKVNGTKGLIGVSLITMPQFFLLLYVDDILITSMDMLEINRVKVLFSFEFEMKNFGVSKKIHGMEIKRDRSKDKLYLSQKGYLEKKN